MSLIDKQVPKRERLLDLNRNLLYNSLKDSEWYPLLRAFLEPLYNPTHMLWIGWVTSPCHFMVDHGLRHVLNVLRYATRLYYDTVFNDENPHVNKHFLEEHVDMVCLIVSIWLHDWGMNGPKPAVPPAELLAHFHQDRTREEYIREYEEELKRKLTAIFELAETKLGHKTERTKDIDKDLKDCMWIRPNHHLITYFNIKEYNRVLRLEDLDHKLENHGRCLEDIGTICLFHGFPLRKLREFGKEHLSGLCALLAFLDGCDENWQRLMSIEHVDAAMSRSFVEGSRVSEKIRSTMKSRDFRSTGIGEKDIEMLQTLWAEGDIDGLLRALDYHLGKVRNDGLQRLKRDVEYYKKSFVNQFENHIEPKSLIDDVYFRNGEIILVPRHILVSEENEAVKKTLKGIMKHFSEYSEGLEKLGLRYTENTIRLWRPGDPEPEKLEIPELGPIQTIGERIEENTVFPTAWDFDNKLVYLDEKEGNEIWETLQSESGRCCLLFGAPSSRKTTFSLAFGSQLSGKGYSVFYREVEEEEDKSKWRELAESLKLYDDEKCIFIFDECHKSPDIIGEFLNRVRLATKRARFIFISTEVSKDTFQNQKNNYFVTLKSTSKHAWSDPTKVFEGVIKQYCASKSFDEERIGDLDKIYGTCGRKFTILNELLGAWERSYVSGKKLDEIPKEKIYEKVLYDYLKTDPRAKMLAKLAVIYQFGVGISPDFLASERIEYGNPEWDVFMQLKNEGLVIQRVSTMTRKRFVALSDPAFAKLLLDAAEHFRYIRNTNEFSFDTLKKYLCVVKERTLWLLASIREAGYQQLGERLVQDRETILALREYFALLKSPVFIRKFLNLLRAFNISKNDEETIIAGFPRVQWCDRIFADERIFGNPRKIQLCLRLLLRLGITENEKEKIVSKISKEILERWSQHFSKNKDILVFTFLLKELMNINREKAKEFLGIIGPNELAEIYRGWINGKKKRRRVGLLTDMVNHLGRVSKDFSSSFLDQFTEEELIDFLDNSMRDMIEKKKYAEICRFMIRCGFSDKTRRALKVYLDRYGVTELLNFLGLLDLAQDAEFIRITYWHETVRCAYRLFEKNVLPQRFRVDTLEDITKYIVQMSEIHFALRPFVGRELARRAIELLVGLDDFDQKVKEGSLKEVQNLASMTKELDTNDLLICIENKLEDDCFNLSGKITEADIENIGFFIWNVSHNPRLAAKCNEVLKNVKSELTSKIRESKLHGAIIFLWSLFVADSELLPEFLEIKKERERERAALGAQYEHISETLSFIGLSILIQNNPKGIIDPSIRRSIHNSREEMVEWCNARLRKWDEKRRIGCLGRGFPDLLKFILSIKGFAEIDEEECVSFLYVNFGKIMENLTSDLRGFKHENRRSEMLVGEFRIWLSAQGFSEEIPL